MTTRKTLHVTGREAWRDWLATHSHAETDVWLIFDKKHTGRPRIANDDAVEEALCFGWIDSIVKRIDDEQYMQKFTPRRDTSKWSALNKQRLRKLLREGRMTEAGLAKVDAATLRESKAAPKTTTTTDASSVHRVVTTALMPHPKAWKNFQRLSASRRAAYIRMISDAKTAATRRRRVQQAVALLEQSTGDAADVPRFIEQALMANAKAWENFQNLAPSYRRHYVGWIMHAKKDETREKRLGEAVALLAQNKKLGLK